MEFSLIAVPPVQCCHPGVTSVDNLSVTLGTKKVWESLLFGLQVGHFEDSRTVRAVYINSKFMYCKHLQSFMT